MRHWGHWICVPPGVSWSVNIVLSWSGEPSKCRRSWLVYFTLFWYSISKYIQHARLLTPSVNSPLPTRRPTARSWQPCWKDSRRTGGRRPHEGKGPSLTLPGWNLWLKSSFSWSGRGRLSLTSYTGEHQDPVSPDSAGRDSRFSSNTNQRISSILEKKLNTCGRKENRSGRRRGKPENGSCKRWIGFESKWNFMWV